MKHEGDIELPLNKFASALDEFSAAMKKMVKPQL